MLAGLTASAAPGPRQGAIPSWCTSEWEVNRTEACYTQTSQWEMTDEHGTPVGGMTYKVTNYLKADPKSTQVYGYFQVDFPYVWGQAVGADFTYTTGCTSVACKPLSFYNGGRIGQGASFYSNDAYTDSPAASTQDRAEATYKITIRPLGGNEVAGDWNSPYFRCDDQVPGSTAGCVMPNGRPVTDMRYLPTISAGIRKVQSAPLHMGQPDSPNPLTRSTSPTVESDNRKAACPVPGVPKPTTPAGTVWSCDEYPFATTLEGAAKTPPPNSGSVWVPKAENDSQGGTLSAFYAAQRVLNGDKFYVAA
ncbi:hypothetical protein ATKI12_8830 [Kitasatospora sp. Ki12]